ncbi:hypothetical protein ACHAXR_000541, partial [Thalassiosira sp. AJA248-18]
IQRINDLELEKGLTHTSASWHTKYKDSAWVYAGNLPLDLTESDILCISSQYGEIEDMHLVRDGDSGKSKGFAFVKYEDARSCVLAVDKGSMVLGRTLRVDHVEKYRLPKHVQEKEDEKLNEGAAAASAAASKSSGGAAEAGHAYKDQELANSYNIQSGQDLFAPPPKDESGKLADQPFVGEHGNCTADGREREERKRRKEMRAQKRREKEEHRRRKEERKRKKR